MNKFGIWDNGGVSADRYTVLKNGRVYVMSDGKDNTVEYVGEEGFVDYEWMDKHQKRVELAEVSAEVYKSIERCY